jgi:hypothetical protein
LNFPAITGNLVIDMKGGVDTVDVGTSNGTLAVGGNVSIKTGQGDDDLTLIDTDIPSGNLTIDTSDGVDTLVIDLFASVSGTTVGGDVSIKTGMGNDDLDLQNADIIGNLSIGTSHGDDDVFVFVTAVGGDATVDTSDGDDEVLLSGLAPADNFTVGGDLTVETGKGDDQVDIDETVVGGDLEIATSWGLDTVEIDTTQVDGGTSIETSNDTDMIDIFDSIFGDGVGSDPFEVSAGSGDDRIDIDDSTITSGTTAEIKGGPGDDMYFDSGNTWAAALDILMSDGNDVVDIDLTFGPSTFEGPLEINGGNDFDTLSLNEDPPLMGGNTFPGGLTVKNFEAVTP